MRRHHVAVWVVLHGILGLSPALPASALEPQPISFLAADGQRIVADYYPPPTKARGGAPMVILLHMYKSDRTAWKPLIEPLHDAGFAILAPDLRGHGESATTETRERADRRDTALFREMQDDLRGAYDWLATQPEVDRARFALVGASVGASVALQYAVKDCSVDTIVCLSPGLNYFDLDSAGDIHQLTGRRVLLVANEAERDAPYTLQKRTSGVDVQTYRGAAHGTDLLGSVPGIEQRIVAFLSVGLDSPSQSIVYGSINSNIYHPPDSGWIARISATNLRYYSSPAEAEARGLRLTRSKKPSEGTDRADRSGRRS